MYIYKIIGIRIITWASFACDSANSCSWEWERECVCVCECVCHFKYHISCRCMKSAQVNNGNTIKHTCLCWACCCASSVLASWWAFSADSKPTASIVTCIWTGKRLEVQWSCAVGASPIHRAVAKSLGMVRRRDCATKWNQTACHAAKPLPAETRFVVVQHGWLMPLVLPRAPCAKWVIYSEGRYVYDFTIC